MLFDDLMPDKNARSASLGFERTLFEAADKMRGHMDPSDYKHIALGLIFLKYISDAFEVRHSQLTLWTTDPSSDYYIEDPTQRHKVTEEPDEYLADNIFWVPREARWTYLQANAKQPTIGTLVDEAMLAIEKANPRLKGVLPKDYARPALDKTRLGELIDLISTVTLSANGQHSQDILGRVYEYFLGRFASAEGKAGGDFYTPQAVVKLLVQMIEPLKGRVYDPCCGSGGMFVQSERFVEAHGGRIGSLSIFGQESNPTTWRLCNMNLAIRGIEGNIGDRPEDTLQNDLHPDLKADYILANPPFNISYWGGDRLRNDVRWKYGVPPATNANYAWVQHIIHHLAPNGIAGFVLANGSMSSNTGGEDDIRRTIIEADLVDCMVALPGQLFYTTQIPACLWFVTRNKSNGRFRDRRGQLLFIDARKLGYMEDRIHRGFGEEDIARVTSTYHAWRGEPEAGEYMDVAGFCKSATIAEIEGQGYVLTPGRYVGAEEVEASGEPFEEKLVGLVAQLGEQFAESARLERIIVERLRRTLDVI
jgi:type I restriction enzyme M protein